MSRWVGPQHKDVEAVCMVNSCCHIRCSTSTVLAALQAAARAHFQHMCCWHCLICFALIASCAYQFHGLVVCRALGAAAMS